MQVRLNRLETGILRSFQWSSSRLGRTIVGLDVHQHNFQVVKPKKNVRIGGLDVKPVVEKPANVLVLTVSRFLTGLDTKSQDYKLIK